MAGGYFYAKKSSTPGRLPAARQLSKAVVEIKTAKVPSELVQIFEKAEELVSKYFGHRVEDPGRGRIEISGERYVLIRAASLSVEFFTLVEKLYGPGREAEAVDFARNILFDLAHSIGRSDARRFHERMGLVDPLERLSAGPLHFAYTGWAFVDISPESKPAPGPDFYMIYDHPNSFEADAWIQADRGAEFPVCIMSSGYSSGWCEESIGGAPLVASEVLCRAKGDRCCRFVMASPETIDEQVDRYLAGQPSQRARKVANIPDFFSRKRAEEELRAARDELERKVIERTTDLQRANQRLREEIVERERIEQQLHKTQRLESLGRLGGGVAHDFNNLLGVIMGYSTILQRRIPEDDPKCAMLAEITEAAQVAASLTRQLLAFGRRQLLSKRHIDLNETVAEMCSLLRRLLRDDVRLETHLLAESPVIEADVSQIEQVLMNLVVNARDAMPQGGTVSVSTKHVSWEGKSAVRLTVADSGVGMDLVTQSKIFDPFFTTKTDKGNGLGLSTVYGIVKQSGGTITVESAPNKGARFDITLPIVEGESPTPPHNQPAKVPAGMTVLLVEDRVGFRALMAEIMEDAGYRVLVAHDTDDALRIAENHPAEIHALVTDVVMPRLHGRELAERVITLRPAIKTLFISGHIDDPDILSGEMSGRASFLAKPFTPDELDQEIRDLLGVAR